MIETEGPILGLLEGTTYAATSGEMRSGDALLLYTDGMVETRTRDIASGIDKMLGQAERLLRGDFEAGLPASSSPSARATMTVRCCSSTCADVVRAGLGHPLARVAP